LLVYLISESAKKENKDLERTVKILGLVPQSPSLNEKWELLRHYQSYLRSHGSSVKFPLTGKGET